MKLIKLLLCGLLIIEQAAFPLEYLFAEESSKPFMQDLQGDSDEGGPMLDEDPVSTPAASPAKSTAARTSTASQQSANVPGTPVQIGGSNEINMYQNSEPKSPLDRVIGPIRLKGSPLTSFLDVISAQSGVSFIVADGVEAKTMTIFLRKTTVREALELLLRVKGLTYQRIGKSNTYIVQKRTSDTPNLVTKIYTLNYIPLIPMASAEAEIGSIMSADVSSSNGGGGEETAGRGGGESATGGNTDSAVAILSVIKGVLTKKHGTITTDARSNSLIVTDVPEVFPQIEEIISMLDIKAPQILIEAQIVEVNTERLNELGIEWGGSRGEMVYFQGPARATDYLVRPNFFSGEQWKSFFGTYTEGSAATGYTFNENGIQSGVLSFAKLEATFRALISRGEGRYLGKPKIIAMNNKAAVITTSKDAATGVEATNSSSGGSTGTSSTSVERRRVGLTLKVTPQVNKEGYITLQVNPSYSDVVASGVVVNGQTVYDPTTRGAATMVRVKNGQTVVIGGMLSSSETKTVRKVPLLGYIPIIGWLFTSISTQHKNTDLVMFITPTILVD